MSAGWPRVRFCESPDADSATRLDLHNAGIELNGDIAVLADGFSLGMASVSSPPGSRIQSLGLRTAALPLRTAGTKKAAVASLNMVARELMRPTNWLEVQVSADLEPRWLRTYASMPEPVSLDRVYADSKRPDTWTTVLQLAGDSFWLGPEEALGEWTVTNHPSSGDHPMVVELPEVDGEASAPLRVLITKAATGGMLGPAVGVARVAPVVTSAPGSWGSAVGSAVTAAGWIAGSYRQTTGSLSDWAAVGTWTPEDVPAGQPRWLALLRVAGSSSAGAFRLRWRVQAAGVSSAVYSPPVVVDVQTQSRWVRSGEVPVPMLDLSLMEAGLGVTADTTLTLEAQRITTGGELRLDAPLVLVPAGPGAVLLGLSPDALDAAATVLVDADARRVGMAAGAAPARTPGVAGGWPGVVPGQPNVLSVLQSLDSTIGSGFSDSITSTSVVSVSYRPRYLWGV